MSIQRGHALADQWAQTSGGLLELLEWIKGDADHVGCIVRATRVSAYLTHHYDVAFAEKLADTLDGLGELFGPREKD